jgi:deoxyadenosine/deoxycytidine kinase
LPYVCIAGNTGAGKSTLLTQVGSGLERSGYRVRLVDESTLHHRLLQHMFDDPSSWAFVIQLNFLIQRVATIMESALDDESIMLMERSPSEDPLFFDRLVRRGHVDSELVPHYYSLSTALRARVPEPIGYIYIDASPDICLARLNAAMASGSRPVELQGKALEQYVNDMDVQYRKWRLTMPSGTNICDLQIDRSESSSLKDIKVCLAAIESWVR